MEGRAKILVIDRMYSMPMSSTGDSWDALETFRPFRRWPPPLVGIRARRKQTPSF